ncbi:flagellar hook-basal body complex protein FliE [Kistimonas asteriae]|uniref:flagellar hook-basal body complex protein FliE n=1 Tax=Kistimonas asteriae TaxID=517724 RepID=UPI001BA69A24|nr:flagellar hook-basal body complex protein FliE [Kistimonas asteriae]
MADVVQPVFIALDLPLAAHQADSRAMTSLSDTNDAVATGMDFSRLLKAELDQVNALQQTASDRMNRVESGQEEDLVGTVLSVQKASLSFQLLLQVRNRLVEGYHEVFNLQL